MKMPLMVAGDYDTHFSVENMRKDSALALELAKSVGLETPGIAVANQVGEDIEHLGFDRDDLLTPSNLEEVEIQLTVCESHGHDRPIIAQTGSERAIWITRLGLPRRPTRPARCQKLAWLPG